jgi:tetratricopeptide (TPR) repeat protein
MADAFESLYGEEAASRAPDVAYHLYQAGAGAERARTLHWQLLAAERALAALAFEEALRDLDAARNVLPAGDGASAARLLRLRARALRGLGQIDAALAALAEALASAPPGEERDATLQARARLKLDLFRGREAIDDLDTLLARARQSGDRARELELLLLRSRGLYIRSLDEPDVTEPMRAAHEEAYALAKELGNRRAMCRALIPTAFFGDYWEDYRQQGIANIREARALAAELGDDELELEAASAGLQLTFTGEALTVEATRIRERLEARRDPVRLKEHLFWLMWHHLSRAELEKCVATCDDGIALAAQLGSPPVQYASIKGLALLDLGRFGDALDAFHAEVADDEHPFGRCMRDYGLAHWLEAVGALDRAEAAGKQAWEDAARLSRTWMQRGLADLLGSVAARSGAAGAALEAWLERKGDATGFRPSSLVQAELLLARGETAEALRRLDTAIAQHAGAGRRRLEIVARETALRALARLERWDDVLARADALLADAEATGYATRAWRVLATRARARAATGDATGAERDRAAARAVLARMAASIPDAALRAAFEREAGSAELAA